MYIKFFKRFLDIVLSSLALIALSWLLAIIAILVKVKLGSPVIHTANRIGKDGKAFKLYKFRSMTNERDEEGKLLPDEKRLTKFGRILRAISLDELPELVNILKGDMSIIGPRPMPEGYRNFFTERERKRHTVRPGLSGWAQVNGRNSLSWEEKFELDVWYTENISFILDVKTIFYTIFKVIKREDIGQGEQMPVSLHRERAAWKITENGAINPEVFE
ncbi:MAG: sugar transferase [Clostridia bacterium]|nr:sugar transferase [Clostridia bacterium]